LLEKKKIREKIDREGNAKFSVAIANNE